MVVERQIRVDCYTKDASRIRLGLQRLGLQLQLALNLGVFSLVAEFPR